MIRPHLMQVRFSAFPVLQTGCTLGTVRRAPRGAALIRRGPGVARDPGSRRIQVSQLAAIRTAGLLGLRCSAALDRRRGGGSARAPLPAIDPALPTADTGRAMSQENVELAASRFLTRPLGRQTQGTSSFRPEWAHHGDRVLVAGDGSRGDPRHPGPEAGRAWRRGVPGPFLNALGGVPASKLPRVPTNSTVKRILRAAQHQRTRQGEQACSSRRRPRNLFHVRDGKRSTRP